MINQEPIDMQSQNVFIYSPPDQLLQPGISRGSSLHLHGHRRPLILLLQHLLLLQPVLDQVQATVFLRGATAGECWSPSVDSGAESLSATLRSTQL